MTQKIVRNKLVAFLQCLPRTQTKEPDVKNLEKALEEGYCFGLSVCHGAMDLIGKLEWWEDALKTIAKWDETKASLDKKIHLINENDPTHPPTLRQLFERVLNYLVFFHVTDEVKNFIFEGMNQDSLIQVSPLSSYFELINEQGKLETINDYEAASGSFSFGEFNKLLDQECFAQTLALVHDDSHTIRIGYRNPYWIVYDPNYDHLSDGPIYKKFSSKKKLFQEIQSILSQAISITTSSLSYREQRIFPEYLLLVSYNPLLLIKNKGLHLSARCNPQNLMHLLESINNHKQVLKLKNALANALTETGEDGWTGLHALAYDLPRSLPILLQMMDTSEAGIKLTQAFATALEKKTQKNSTGLNFLAGFCYPEIWPLFNKLMDDSPAAIQLKKAFSSALFELDEEGESAFYWLFYDAGSRQLLLKHFPKLDKLTVKILNSIVGENEVSVFYWLTNSPEGLQLLQTHPQIFSMVDKETINAVHNKDGVSAFYRLIENRNGAAVLMNCLPVNTRWFRNIDAETCHLKPAGDKPSIAELLTQTRHGKRLMETFPQLKRKVFPEKVLGKRRAAEDQLAEEKPIRSNKRQKKEVEEKPSKVGLFASRDNRRQQAIPMSQALPTPMQN